MSQETRSKATWALACAVTAAAFGCGNKSVSTYEKPNAEGSDLVQLEATTSKACVSNTPSWQCVGGDTYCSEMTTFEPRRADGYWNYPKNGETESDLYRSYARRDLIRLVRHATAATLCATRNWKTGIGGDLGLGDMSEADGSIPGTRDGYPGHPEGSHTLGGEMDIAYFQREGSDNKLRPICEHVIDGKDQYHCVAEPDNLDWERTAYFVARLHDNPDILAVGVDGRIGPKLGRMIGDFCRRGILTGNACRKLKLAYETKDTGIGWFHFHHHHLHVSLVSYEGFLLNDDGKRCLTPGCSVQEPATKQFDLQM